MEHDNSGKDLPMPGDPSDKAIFTLAYEQTLEIYDLRRSEMLAVIAAAHPESDSAGVTEALWFAQEAKSLEIPEIGSNQVIIRSFHFDNLVSNELGVTNPFANRGWHNQVALNVSLLKDDEPFVAEGDDAEGGNVYSIIFTTESAPILVQASQVEVNSVEAWQSAHCTTLDEATAAQIIDLLSGLDLDASDDIGAYT
jgi:hypothetical protein